jgi:hypothetical protein
MMPLSIKRRCKTYSVVWIVLIIIAIVIMNVNFKRKQL